MAYLTFDRQAFAPIIQSLVDESFLVYWATDPEPNGGDLAHNCVQLDVVTIQELGIDEHRRMMGPPGYAATDYVTFELGNRLVRVNIQVKVYDPYIEASEVLDQIRTKIRADATHDALFAIGLALVETSGSVNVRLIEDNRRVNCATCDITFGAVAAYVSNVQHNEGWIDTVNGNNIVPGTITS